MMDNLIPEDLQEILSRVLSDNPTVSLAYQCAIPNGKVRQLIERIGRVEQENAKLKALLDKRNIIVRCSYCGDPICKESEWDPKVPEHMAKCDKSPVIKMVAENEKLKARTLSCLFCGAIQKSVGELKDHSATCAKHPAVMENLLLKAQVKRLSAPVSDEEWGVCDVPSMKDIDSLHRSYADAIIAARVKETNLRVQNCVKVPKNVNDRLYNSLTMRGWDLSEEEVDGLIAAYREVFGKEEQHG